MHSRSRTSYSIDGGTGHLVSWVLRVRPWSINVANDVNEPVRLRIGSECKRGKVSSGRSRICEGGMDELVSSDNGIKGRRKSSFLCK